MKIYLSKGGPEKVVGDVSLTDEAEELLKAGKHRLSPIFENLKEETFLTGFQMVFNEVEEGE